MNPTVNVPYVWVRLRYKQTKLGMLNIYETGPYHTIELECEWVMTSNKLWDEYIINVVILEKKALNKRGSLGLDNVLHPIKLWFVIACP